MRIVLALVVSGALLTGCGLQVERTPTRAELAVHGARFGGVVLPGDVDVVAARHDDRGPDESYRIVVTTNPAGARHLIEASGLMAEPQQATQNLFSAPLAGPALADEPGVESWKNWVTIGGKRIVRDVTVDGRTTPVYVHLLLYEAP